MADTQRKNLLSDLASAARREQETRIMSPARALRLGLARAAAQLLDLPLQVSDLKISDTGLEGLGQALPPDMLLALLDGPDGARGAVGMDRALVTSLIEVQTMGTVSNLAVSDRRLTPTDAAMVAPWLDAALERVDVALCQDADGDAVEGVGDTIEGKDNSWLIGYRFGAMAEDGRALVLALESPQFRLIRVTLDVALGRRSGDLLLLLPFTAKPEAPVKTPRDTPEEAFLAIPAEMRVVAGRLSLPLSRAGSLRAGDVLPLDEMFMDRAELRAVDGKMVGKARLGRLGDHWAVRFSGTAPEAAAQLMVEQSKSAKAEGTTTTSGMTTAAPAPSPAEIAPPAQISHPPIGNEPERNLPETLPDLPPLDFDDPVAGPGPLPPFDAGEGALPIGDLPKPNEPLG
ncbi:FliM/FliN family flagellar motor switch protein [Marinovum sp. 2_MG-2023]|uniref:FliM/FliN family flagellar motor switch protein n=1 Tax=unclassified Marinovum TaxID=2647166 RepID=UPI0026E159B7|nr:MULTISPECIES: flagellar motor switch protein FliM [unclassified Marinovum]MDO6728887.1 FliM/FliN family flagellar motor switch protein [Marinovum sp. 2_MG-2023]MDO6777697.1 FliM/FliN family flagellar motor switch protein [Marinovum sp. 1_MG-2023]